MRKVRKVRERQAERYMRRYGFKYRIGRRVLARAYRRKDRALEKRYILLELHASVLERLAGDLFEQAVAKDKSSKTRDLQ